MSDEWNLPAPTTPEETPATPQSGYTTAPESLGSVDVVSDFTVPDTPVLVQASTHFEYAVSKVLYDESGLHVNAVAGPPGTPADVCRLTGPASRMVVCWSSKRRGALPIIPSRDMQDANLVYLRGQVGMVVPGYLLDGTKCHAVSGRYEYALRLPYSESDPITIGALPYSTEVAVDNVLSPNSYATDIIGPNKPPAAASGLPPIDF